VAEQAAEHAGALFSPGFCPECYAKELESFKKIKPD
jgi:hypothetical protein